MHTENRWRLSREGTHSYERGKGGETSLQHLVRLPEDRRHFTEVWNKNLGELPRPKEGRRKSHLGTKKSGGPHSRRCSLGLSGTWKATVVRPRARWAVGWDGAGKVGEWQITDQRATGRRDLSRRTTTSDLHRKMITCHQWRRGCLGTKAGAHFDTITLVQHAAQSGLHGQAVGGDLSSTDKGQRQLA